MDSYTETDESGGSERQPPRLTLDVPAAGTGQRVLVSVTGDLDVEASTRLLKELSGSLTERREVEIDLSRVTFLDVPGARALIRVRDLVIASGGSVRVLGLDDERLPAARVLDLRRHLEDRAPRSPESR